MLRQVCIDRDLTLSNISIDLLGLVFPIVRVKAHEKSEGSAGFSPSTNIRSPAYVHRSTGINGRTRDIIETSGNDKVFVHFWSIRLNASDEKGSDPDTHSAVALRS